MRGVRPGLSDCGCTKSWVLTLGSFEVTEEAGIPMLQDEVVYSCPVASTGVPPANPQHRMPARPAGPNA